MSENGLKHVHEEDGVLFREDGGAVLRFKPLEHGVGGVDPIASAFLRDPNRLVRIAGTSTWVGAGGRMARIVAGRVIQSFPVGLARGELAADAGLMGVVYVHGDSLLRAETGTRIGQVLEGQTHVRVGASLGFAFYRAGDITVAFVFDPRKGALRQVHAFPRIEGKLLGWSAVFDEAHVLVTFATESAGRVEHAVHLVDARGEIHASERSCGGTPLTASLTGRALAGGSILAATDDGLVLLRPNRSARTFIPTRLFAEANDLVSPDAELLVGPGGSIFVVTHDEITHLCFTDRTP